VLFVEKLPWTDFDFAIPYPTYFHPAKDAQILEWQRRMRAMKRRWLFSFAGSARNDPYSIRHHLIRQCGSSSFCKLVQCRKNKRNCLIPSTFMRVFQGTRFCLQPTGDTMTRRSAFDAIMAGCVPVFFHPDSAHTQYRWHLPEAHETYSVLIPEADVRAGNVSIEETLRRIPPEVAERMTETVIEAGVRGPEVEAGDAQGRRGRDAGGDRRQGEQAEGRVGRRKRSAKLDQKIRERITS
jgi:hypothetical protein